MRKVVPVCSACQQKTPSRFRTVPDAHLCEWCWTFYQQMHRLPTIEDALGQQQHQSWLP